MLHGGLQPRGDIYDKFRYSRVIVPVRVEWYNFEFIRAYLPVCASVTPMREGPTGNVGEYHNPLAHRRIGVLHQNGSDIRDSEGFIPDPRSDRRPIVDLE